MAGITLADIRKAAEDQYGPFVISGIDGGDVTLVNAIRLSKGKRKRLADMQKAQDADSDADPDQLLIDMVLLVASSRSDGERLLEALGDDMAQLAVVLNEYGNATADAADAAAAAADAAP